MHAAKRQSRESSSDDSNEEKRKVEERRLRKNQSGTGTTPKDESERSTESDEDMDRKPSAKRTRPPKEGSPHKHVRTGSPSRASFDDGGVIRSPVADIPTVLPPTIFQGQHQGYVHESGRLLQVPFDAARLTSDSILASVLTSARDRAALELAAFQDEQRRSDLLLSSILLSTQRQSFLPHDISSSLSAIGINASPAPLQRMTSSSQEPSPTRLLQNLLEQQNSQQQLHQMLSLPFLPPDVPSQPRLSPDVFQQRVSMPMLGSPMASPTSAAQLDVSTLNVAVPSPVVAGRASVTARPSLSSPVQAPLPPPPFKTPKRVLEATRLYQRTTPMATDSDRSCLSGFQTVLREQILYFETVPLDVQASSQGRNKPIRVGQVGLVCRHCCDIAPQRRPRGATYFPHRLTSIYQSTQNMAKNHFVGPEGGCPNAPAAVNEKLRAERNKKGLVYGGGQQYWPQTAMEAGVVETDNGLAFAASSTDK